MEVRPAYREDAPGILRCLIAAFAEFEPDYTRLAYADTVLSEETIDARLESMHVLVAIADGELIGTIAYSANDSIGYLRGLAVLPDAQGTGVAASLLREAEERLKGIGAARVVLDTTLPLERAMAFYERHGYTRTGNVSGFFGMPLIEMQKDLQQPFEIQFSRREPVNAILVVDDDEAARSLICECLKSADYATREATNGLEALTLARRFRESLSMVITDIVMPEMDGLALGEKLESEMPEVPTLYVTAYDHPDVDKLQGLLRKPFTPGELLEKVSSLLKLVEP